MSIAKHWLSTPEPLVQFPFGQELLEIKYKTYQNPIERTFPTIVHIKFNQDVRIPKFECFSSYDSSVANPSCKPVFGFIMLKPDGRYAIYPVAERTVVDDVIYVGRQELTNINPYSIWHLTARRSAFGLVQINDRDYRYDLGVKSYICKTTETINNRIYAENTFDANVLSFFKNGKTLPQDTDLPFNMTAEEFSRQKAQWIKEGNIPLNLDSANLCDELTKPTL